MPTDTSIPECEHPPAYVHFTDAGLSVHCGACGVKRRVSRQSVAALMAPKAGGDPDVRSEVYGPTLESVARQALRLDFAIRALGRAFWRMDHTPEQENALELAIEARKGFDGMAPKLRGILDAIVQRFPDAEVLDITTASDMGNSDG